MVKGNRHTSCGSTTLSISEAPRLRAVSSAKRVTMLCPRIGSTVSELFALQNKDTGNTPICFKMEAWSQYTRFELILPSSVKVTHVHCYSQVLKLEIGLYSFPQLETPLTVGTKTLLLVGLMPGRSQSIGSSWITVSSDSSTKLRPVTTRLMTLVRQQSEPGTLVHARHCL